VLRELEEITKRLRGVMAQLETVVERMVGPEGARPGGVQLRVVSGDPGKGSGKDARRNADGPQHGSDRERPQGSAPEEMGGPPAQVVAGRIRGMIQQLETAPGGGSGEAAAAVAEELRGIVERLGQPLPEANGSEQPGASRTGQGES